MNAPSPGSRRPPFGHAIPGARLSGATSGSGILVTEFPSDPGPRSRRGVTTRRSERRGHGARGPILPPEVPRWQSRSQAFDQAALEAFAEVDMSWHSELTHLDLAVDMVPRMRLRPGESWPEEVVADGEVPLARLIPAGVDRLGRPTRAKLVVFRRPLESRTSRRLRLRTLLYEIIVVLVAQHLEISPDEVEDGPGAN